MKSFPGAPSIPSPWNPKTFPICIIFFWHFVLSHLYIAMIFCICLLKKEFFDTHNRQSIVLLSTGHSVNKATAPLELLFQKPW